MKRLIVMVFVLLAAACGDQKAALSTELTGLQRLQPATSVAGAEAYYYQSKAFTKRVDKAFADDNTKVPQWLLDQAHALQEQRVREWKKLVWEHQAVGSTINLLKALVECGVPIVESDWKGGDDRLRLQGVDPTRDTPNDELRNLGLVPRRGRQ